MKKKIRLGISLLLSLLMVFSCVSTAFAVDSEGVFGVEIIDANGTSSIVNWWQSEDDGNYYLFLPSYCNLGNLTAKHDFGSFKIAGKSVLSGDNLSFADNQILSCTVDGQTQTLVVMKSKNLPAMFIDTESGTMDRIHANKNNKEAATMSIITNDGAVDFTGDLDHIKGRGNSTWALPKRPYNIKLSKKASLLGMSESKKWSLLANAQDYSMIRNKVVYDLANGVELDYSPNSEFVDLFANNEYLGTYQLTQKVELGKNQLVKITDLQDATEKINSQDLDTYPAKSAEDAQSGVYYDYYDIPNNPDDITGGYLIEYVYSPGSPSGFDTVNNQSVDVKSPEYASKSQMEYISNYVNDFEQAVSSYDGYNEKGKYYTDYIDIEDAAKMFAIQEFSMNVDAGVTSCFLYKESDITGDGKLHFGPVWDFDVALGNLWEHYGVDLTNPELDWISDAWADFIFQRLYMHDDFIEEYEKVWKTHFIDALDVVNGKAANNESLSSIDSYVNTISESAKLNYVRWPIDEPLVDCGYTFEENINYLKDFVSKRTAYINSCFMSVEQAREEAIKAIDDYVSSLDKNAYTTDEWNEILEAVSTGTAKINESQTSSEIKKIKTATINDIKSVSGVTIYFDNNRAGWDEVNLEYTIYGQEVYEYGVVTMVEGENKLYSVKIPEGSIYSLVFIDSGKNSAGIYINNYEGDFPNLITVEPLMTQDYGSKNYCYSYEMPFSEYSYPMKYTKGLENLKNEFMFLVDYGYEYYSKQDVEKAKIAADELKVICDAMDSYTQEEIDEYIKEYWGIIISFEIINSRYGDVTSDGEVDMADIVMVQKNVAELVEFSEKIEYFADVNEDGIVDMKDVVLIQKYVAEIIDIFPAEEYQPPITGTVTIYYDNSETNWKNVNLYAYNDYFVNGDWPGVKMTAIGDNIFKFEQEVYYDDYIHIIFSYGKEQFPASMEPGFIVEPGDIVLFKDGELQFLDEPLD